MGLGVHTAVSATLPVSDLPASVLSFSLQVKLLQGSVAAPRSFGARLNPRELSLTSHNAVWTATSIGITKQSESLESRAPPAFSPGRSVSA